MRALPHSVVVVAALVLGACEPPPLTVRFSLTDGDSQVCINDGNGMRAESCADMTMYCDAVLSLRIVPPGDPTVPYVTVCKRLLGAHDTVCAISGVDLPQPTVPVPEQVLEVQMAIFPSSVVPTDPVTGELVCPPVDFAATNLPVTALPGCNDDDPGTCPRVPAIGGRAYYYPGDTKTVVKLGCTDFDRQLGPAVCAGSATQSVKATVSDFDTNAFVDQPIANRLTVSIGEPTPLGEDYALFTQDTVELLRTAAAFPASWSGDVDPFNSTRCLVVLEDGAQTTSTLSCEAIVDDDPLDETFQMTGTRLAKSTLSQILTALNQPTFPDAGLTIGIVLDAANNPAAGVTVTSTPPSGTAPSIKYLAANRMSIATTSQTSSSGIFISEDAAYGTLFSAPNAISDVFGGRVEGKVTIVVIHLQSPGSG